MPEGVARLGDVADFVNGRAFKPSDWSSSGVPIVRIQNLNGGAAYNFFEGDVEPRYSVDPGDLLFSWSGTRGTSFGPHIWRGPMGVLNQHIFNVRNLRGVEKDFLFHALDAITAAIAQRAHGGTGIVHITKAQLEAFEVPIPPIDEQRRIAAILSAIDARTASERSVLAGLLDLLTSLCTRFAATTGITEPLGALVAEPIRNGYSPESPRTATGRWTLHLGAVSSEGYVAGAVKPAPLGDLRVEQSLLRAGDIVVSRSNTRRRVGLAALFPGDIERCSYPDLLMRVRCGPRLLPEFLECVLLAPPSRSYFERTARGTNESMVKIDRAILEGLRVPVPPLPEQERGVAMLRALRVHVRQQRELIERTEATKQALARDLLGGPG
jgi:type I restriction enzyme S subunit